MPIYSRWSPSTLTFGPLGRVIATVLIVAPLVFGIFVNVFFLVAAALWAFIVPMALRDVWGRVRVGSRPVQSADPPPVGKDSIATRTPPRRW